MKKIVLALALFALLPASTRAQNWLTLKAGGGMGTNLGYTQDVNSGITTSFGLGTSTKYPINYC